MVRDVAGERQFVRFESHRYENTKSYFNILDLSTPDSPCICSAGDSEHKPYICGDADHAAFPLDGSEDYLILACDGFYDTVSPEEAVRVVSDHLQENNGDTAMVAHKLVASARDAGSSDNITVIVVFLRDPRAPAPSHEPQEEEEEDEVDEEEDEEEEDEAMQGDSVCQDGAGGENGGKVRTGWPLQQCSAPADLAYEERTDSFTDRTSLSITPPGLPPSGFCPTPGRILQTHLRVRSPKPQLSSGNGHWLQAAALLPHQERRKRRVDRLAEQRWEEKRQIRRIHRGHSILSSSPKVPEPLRYPETRPGVALPCLTQEYGF